MHHKDPGHTTFEHLLIIIIIIIISLYSTMSLCQRASFSAENTPITVIPAFSSKTPLPLASSPLQTSVGPFVAGMPIAVPLWMAKLFYQKQLAQIQLPEWLAVDRLKAILQKEKTHELLTTELPFYYYEIARSLTTVLNNTSSSSDGGGGSGGGGSTTTHHQQAALVLVHDLVAVRIDKIRQNFQDLSRDTLVHMEGGEELPMIAVTGIASVELNRVGPFLQRAFSDCGYLVRTTNTTTATTTTTKEGLETTNNIPMDEVGSQKDPAIVKKVATTRSRLRKFRQ